jgi:hypothetical protein
MVADDDMVSMLDQPARKIRAHPAKPDHPDLHVVIPIVD